jgi:hypothetical protein
MLVRELVEALAAYNPDSVVNVGSYVLLDDGGRDNLDVHPVTDVSEGPEQSVVIWGVPRS